MSGARPAQHPTVAVWAPRAARVRRGFAALGLVAALGTTACTPAAGA
ncbi:MAG: hypothetical protein HY908_33080, partial [Myxococcales bacterium]|nr:hypothetical protein [Myxococcales bacterium]